MDSNDEVLEILFNDKDIFKEDTLVARRVTTICPECNQPRPRDVWLQQDPSFWPRDLVLDLLIKDFQEWMEIEDIELADDAIINIYRRVCGFKGHKFENRCCKRVCILCGTVKKNNCKTCYNYLKGDCCNE